MKKFVLALSVLCVATSNAQFCFNQTYVSSIGGSLYGICNADFNGDGNIDLAIADGAATVRILNGTGTGNFTTGSNFAVGSNPEGIITADFNADGKADLACANFSSGNISILLGSGTGNFSPANNIATGVNAKDLAAGDLDGDGDLDLAVANAGASTVTTLLGDGLGSFTVVASYATAGGTPYGICIADFNSDGKKDVATANNAGNNMSLFIGNGNGTLQTATSFGATLTAPFAALANDLDGDGKMDIVVPNMNANTVACFMGNGAGTFTFVNHPLPGGASAPRSVCVADFNGDAIKDIAVANFSSNNISVMMGPGFGPVQNYNAGGGANGVRWITTGDFNNDSKADFATSANTNGYVNAFINEYPYVFFTGNTSICLGNNTTLTASGSTSYTWSANAGSVTTASISVSPTVSTTYSITAANTGCVYTRIDSVHVTVNALPNVTANASSTFACAGSPEILTGSGSAITYTWTGGVTNGVAFPAVLQTYTVTGVDANNCVNTATISINTPTTNAPNICTVTVDSLSLNNVIVWDKTLYQNADSFYVHRDTANNNYVIIARMPYSALSQFIDTARSIGAVNGDPNVTTYHYKLSYKDTCGTMSPLSPYHGSIYQYHINSLFLWNAYDIEGQPSPVPGLSSYALKRDNLGATGNYVVAASAGASSTSINDPAYATWQTTADWRVETVWNIVCVPTQLWGNNNTQAGVVRSKSNITNNRVTGIKTLDKIVSLYPNPTTGNLVVDLGAMVSGRITVKVFSSLGEEVYSANLTSIEYKHHIDLSKNTNGIYLVQLVTDFGVVSKRVVKQ